VFALQALAVFQLAPALEALDSVKRSLAHRRLRARQAAPTVQIGVSRPQVGSARRLSLRPKKSFLFTKESVLRLSLRPSNNFLRLSTIRTSLKDPDPDIREELLGFQMRSTMSENLSDEVELSRSTLESRLEARLEVTDLESSFKLSCFLPNKGDSPFFLKKLLPRLSSP
jgi:hypothetical protein